ncbi:MAG TPA: TetR/AcrR family transcriptional regulator [Smithella sp.]|nr:TetR/AcrR family transcriptional regulator [Smithella sp.]HQO14531.1 TetR/AcrR family transcriptional regulator [Smithellaceae bacterium]HNY49942.1 TetR/AcrR family transcriptional regulator [Smithella sp.]HOG90470.1 TetR/AcrR family transcriptional regulator [Smithella sp.]HOU50631.1 TetR/AcrR family transcriptional regulator [Smithella sp.]
MTIEKPVMPEKLKERLYPVVLRQFSGKDFHAVNIRDISKESGISTGTIYKYFSSKEDLLFSIIDEKLLALASLLRMHLAGTEDIREMFRKLFWVTMNFFDNNPDLAVTAFITVPSKSFMASKSYKRETEVDILNEVIETARKRGAILSELENHYFVDLYMMITQRHIQNWYAHGMKWKLAENINNFFDFFWKVITPLGDKK